MMPGLRASLIRWTAHGLYHTRLIRPVSVAAGFAGASTFQILSYHRVNDDHDPFFRAIPTEVFDRHMAYLARTYRVLTIEALVERARRSRVPRNALAITFDDGYRDTLTHAVPILVRHGLPATVFLATGFIGTGQISWFDRLAAGFKGTTAEVVRAPWGATWRLQGQPERLRALDQALGYLKQRSDDDARRMVDHLLASLAVTDCGAVKTLMLTWEDVHALTGLGCSIGAHTVTHPILSRVSPDRAWREIVGSRAMIEKACGFAPDAFAYPNGRPADYNETVQSLVRKAGFTCAVTTSFGLNTRRTSPYDLRRGGPWDSDLPMFALRLASIRLRGA